MDYTYKPPARSYFKQPMPDDEWKSPWRIEQEAIRARVAAEGGEKKPPAKAEPPKPTSLPPRQPTSLPPRKSFVPERKR
jgi:hypothetical protein